MRRGKQLSQFEPNRELELVQEQLWVMAARGGDAEAFQNLVGMFDRRLLYFVRRFERDENNASDIVQEVWLAAFRKIGQLKSPESFRTWLYRIAHAKVVTTIRKELRTRRLQDDSENCAPRPVPNEQDQIDQIELVHWALQQISPEHREVLSLRFLEAMSLDGIAEVLAVPRGTVKSRMYYAKQAFGKIIEDVENG